MHYRVFSNSSGWIPGIFQSPSEPVSGGGNCGNGRFWSLKSEEKDARSLYEQEYCAWGEMENRIKEAAVTFVCGQGKYRNDACQSTAVVGLVRGVCVTQQMKTDKALFNRILTSTVQHKPHKTAQDWCTGKGKCTENSCLSIQCLSLSRNLSARFSKYPESVSIALLRFRKDSPW